MDYTLSELISFGDFMFLTEADFYNGSNTLNLPFNVFYQADYLSTGIIDLEQVWQEQYDFPLTGGNYYMDFYFNNLPCSYCEFGIGDDEIISSVSVTIADSFDNSFYVYLDNTEYSYFNLSVLENVSGRDLDNYFIRQVSINASNVRSDIYDLYFKSFLTIDSVMYNTGYNKGYDTGYDVGSSSGFNTGYDVGYNEGYNIGYNTGYNTGSDGNQAIGNAIVSVADTPLSIFKSIFDVDIMGFNLASCLLGIAGLTLIVWVIRKFLGGE